MREKAKAVELKPINPDTLKISKVPDTQDQFSIELSVTGFCGEDWKTFFQDQVKKESALLNKSFNFKINWLSIEVTTTPEEILDTIALTKKLVLATNEETKRYNQEVEEEWKIQREQEKIDQEKIRKMRELLRQG
jgi:hypothetical protein